MCLPDNDLDNLKIRRTLVSNTTEQTSNLIVSNNIRRGRNSPGLCPRRVRSREIEFRHRLFPFFHFFRLQSTQTAIWTRIRPTIRTRAEFDQHKQILLRIRTTIRARAIVTVEKCAREAASLGAPGHDHSARFSIRRASVFGAISGTFFSKMVPTGASDGLKNVTQSHKKRT